MKITLKQAVTVASFLQYTAASVTMHKLIKQLPGNKILKSIGANALDGVIAYPYMKELQEIMLSDNSMWDACIEIPGPKDLVKKVSNMMSKIALKQLEKSSDDDDEDEDDEDDLDDEDDNDKVYLNHGIAIELCNDCLGGLYSVCIFDYENRSEIRVYADPVANNDIGEEPEETINGIWEWLRYLRPSVIVTTSDPESFKMKNKNTLGQYFAVLTEEINDGVEQYKIGVYDIMTVTSIDADGKIKPVKFDENLAATINDLVLHNSTLMPYDIQ